MRWCPADARCMIQIWNHKDEAPKMYSFVVSKPSKSEFWLFVSLEVQNHSSSSTHSSQSQHCHFLLSLQNTSLHLGMNIMPQMRVPPAWSRQPTVSKDASPNGWRQGQCGTTARAAASDLDRGPLEKPVVAAVAVEGIRLERRKTRKRASSLMEAEQRRFTLEDPDVQQGPAKYPQCRTRERFARILPPCIFF